MNFKEIIAGVQTLELLFNAEIEKKDKEIENLKNIHQESLDRYLEELDSIKKRIISPTSEELSNSDNNSRILELRTELDDLIQINKKLKDDYDELSVKFKLLNEENARLNQVVATQKKTIDVLFRE